MAKKATKATIRERIIGIMFAHGSITRFALEHAFNGPARSKAEEEISNLLSSGILVQTGIGTRGRPFIIHRSPVWPFREKCAMCGQSLPLEAVLAPEETKQIKAVVEP